MAKVRWIERAMVSLNMTNFCSGGIACDTQYGSGEEIHSWKTDQSTARLTISSLVKPAGRGTGFGGEDFFDQRLARRSGRCRCRRVICHVGLDAVVFSEHGKLPSCAGEKRRSAS
jgi:hypothetical protein